MADLVPFGDLAPTPMQERVRRVAAALPYTYAGRKLASLLLGAAGARQRRAFDVEIFDGAKARLHPYDNIAEKRVYLTPHHWDPQERAYLAQEIAGHLGATFTFVDIGANAGLYSLFALSQARHLGKTLRGVCVEPDPVMLSRLRFNIAASGAADLIGVLPVAASDKAGEVSIVANEINRGMTHVSHEQTGSKVQALPLEAILRQIAEDDTLDDSNIDAVKIDIEGHEAPVLMAFFQDAPRPLWPRLIIMEISHHADDGALGTFINAQGYDVVFQNQLNVILKRRGPA